MTIIQKNKVLLKILGAITLALIIVSLFQKVEAQESFCKTPLSVGYPVNLQPWYFTDENGKFTGLGIDLINAVLENMGCSAEFKQQTLSRQLLQFKFGKLDIGLDAYKTPRREESAYFSDPYLKMAIVLLVRKGESQKYPLSKLSDIINIPFKLGYLRGGAYGEEFSKLLENPQFRRRTSPVAKISQSVKMLMKDRIQGFLGPIQTYEDLSITMGNNVERHRGVAPLVQNTIHYMISKKRPLELVNAVNRSIKQLRANGTVRRIVTKYNKK
ncbi:MAG: amino acid ABC transporter substrate-binding protein [Deltaproteobacteria bacterium]|nr:amino acid ABC transporter substrate-binding protein [Deltaproteobacteria bacterium]